MHTLTDKDKEDEQGSHRRDADFHDESVIS